MNDPRTPRRRLILLLCGIALWSAAIVGRLVEVQVYRADELRELARRQHSSTVQLDPVRGTIYDRNGIELAVSRDVFSVYAVPGLVTSPEQTVKLLEGALRIDRRKVLRRLRMDDRNFVWVARKISDAEAEEVVRLNLPGIALLEEPKRFYPRDELAAQVLGYVGLDNQGLAGIEQEYDDEIRGVPGVKLTLRDARGLRFMPEPHGHPARPGRNLVLTLDARIQHVLERELQAARKESRARRAFGVVLDPWTGDVLAMAGEPSFDPNHYARASPAARRNVIVQETYEPGSTFKIMTFAAALEEGRLRLGEHIDCGHGGIRVAGQRIGDHRSFDVLTPTEIIAQSSNVGAIVVGTRLDREVFHRHLRSFGFGTATGIQLPGESAGILRPPQLWSGRSQASISFGQEVAVTPLQLATAFAAVANGGVVVKPRIVLRLEEPSGEVAGEVPAGAVRRVLSPETAAILTGMMSEVVRTGTATAAQVDGIEVAGKTGTAEKIVDGRYSPDRFVASFVAIAPSHAPRLVVLVALDEPGVPGFHGGQVAAPAVRRILEPSLVALGVPADARTIEQPIEDYYPDAARGAPSAFPAMVARRGVAEPAWQPAGAP